VEWRFRKGLEGAPKAAVGAILRRLDAKSEKQQDFGGQQNYGYDDEYY